MKRLLPFGVLLFALCAFPASGILDTNSNGLSDLWERAYNGGDLFASMDPLTDDDSDGWTNAQEAAAGTDPFDANPPDGLLRPDIVHIPELWEDQNNDNILELVTPEAVIISWTTIPGKQYTLLYSPDLVDWLPVPNEDFIGNGSVVDYYFTLDEDDKLFWRVKIEDIDSDSDGLTDAEETELGTNPNLADTDGDDLNDLDEILQGTDPRNADTDGDGIPDNLDSQPNTPRGAPPTISSQTASSSQVVNLLAGEKLSVLLTVHNPAGPPVTTSNLALLVNGTEESTTFTQVAENQFSFFWDAIIHANYPSAVLQSLAVRFRDAENATAWLDLGSCDVAEWEGEIAMTFILYSDSANFDTGMGFEIESHINGRRYVYGFGNTMSGNVRFYRGPHNIAVRNEDTHGTIATFQIPPNVKLPLFLTRFTGAGLSVVSTLDAGDYTSFPHNSDWWYNTTSYPIRCTWGGVVTDMEANSQAHADYDTDWGDAPFVADWWRNGEQWPFCQSTWRHPSAFTSHFSRTVFSVWPDEPFGSLRAPRISGFSVWTKLPASITPHLAATLEFPGAPIHPFAIEKEGTLFLVTSETYHQILYKVDPVAEQWTDGIKLHLGQTSGETTSPQEGIGLYESTPSGLAPVSLDASGDILLSPTENTTLYRKLTGSDGLPLFLKRTSAANQPHTLEIRLLSKFETNKETTVAAMNLLPIDIEEVISDQIAGNEANKLPTAFYGGQPNNPMLMGTRSGSDARLMIKMNVPAAQAASIRVGVRQKGQTEILNSVSSVAPPGKTPLSFTALAGSKTYEVVAGNDANSNASLDPSEATIVFQKTPKTNSADLGGGAYTGASWDLVDKFIVVTHDDFVNARSATDDYGTGATINTFFPTAAKMVAGFARGASTITGSSSPEFDVLLDASTIPSPDGLSHPLGGKWNTAKQTATHRLVLPTGSDLSEDVVGSTGLRNMYARALWNHRATIAAGATTSWGVVNISFTDKDIDFSASDTNDQVHAALGKCEFVGSLEVSCKLKAGGGFDVGALNCCGAMVDLYDFAYGARKVTVLGIDIADPKEAARTQAGFATLTFSPWPDAGRVFFTKVEFGTGWFNYTGSYPP